MALKLNVVVSELAELAVVEANLLLLGAGAQGQARYEVHEEENDAGHDEGVSEASGGVGQLVA